MREASPRVSGARVGSRLERVELLGGPVAADEGWQRWPKGVGLPLDVRHVTLSTGSLAFAGALLGPTALQGRSFLVGIRS